MGAISMVPSANQLADPLGAHAVVQRVVERPQVRRQLLVHVARQVAEVLARLDGRARQHDPRDAAVVQRLDRGGDGEIGLAGPCRAHRDRQAVRLDRVGQPLLARTLRADLADVALVAPLFRRVVRRRLAQGIPARDQLPEEAANLGIDRLHGGVAARALGHAGLLSVERDKAGDRTG
jgi:hypothetical protein